MIADVLAEQAPEVRFVEDDRVVEQFRAGTTDEGRPSKRLAHAAFRPVSDPRIPSPRAIPSEPK
jgi:hypothetical protein